MNIMRGLAVTMMGMMCAVMPMELAMGEVLLPDQLQVIEEEAFAGDTALEGLLVLPDTVRTVSARAFAGTHVYALRVPQSVEMIGSEAVREAAYVYLEGSGTKVAEHALDGVHYVFAPDDAALESFVPHSQLVEYDGFYYQKVGDGLKLLCAVDAETVDSTITIPETIEKVDVTAIGPDAFYGCGKVELLRLPYGVTEDSAMQISCPDAVKDYYSDTRYFIKTLQADKSKMNVGDTVTWTVTTNKPKSLASKTETYRYEVYCSGAVVNTVESSNNSISVVVDQPGQWAVKATCCLDKIQCWKKTSSITVGAPVRVVDLSCGSDYGKEHCTTEWKTAVTGGHGALTYAYEVKKDGVPMAVSAVNDTLILTDMVRGSYEIKVTVRDADGCSGWTSVLYTVMPGK